LIPYFPPIFEYYLHYKKIKFIIDYDDAIFHNYDNNSNILIRKVFKNKIPYIVKLATHIITGSPYLTQILADYNNKISEIPTSIDINLYNNKYINKTVNNSNNIIIGWIGSKTTSVNLIYIREALIDLTKKFPNIQFHFCGFDKALISEFTFKNCKFFEWTVENEFVFLNNVSIGIMPLENNLFNMGKCGFKLIQYMAMGKPTVSFPFPANLKINHNNGNLFARTSEEWYSTLSHMITHFDNYKLIGEKNRKIVEYEYSIQSNFHKYIAIIKNL